MTSLNVRGMKDNSRQGGGGSVMNRMGSAGLNRYGLITKWLY